MNNTPKWADWTDIEKYDQTQYVFEYVYGVEDIQIMLKEFQEHSAYVTTPIQLEGNIMGVSMEVDESNIFISQAHENTNQYDTAIEHYISFVEHPTLSDWKPILPVGQTAVINELLFPNLPLRFTADTSEPIRVYKNNAPLSEFAWILSGNTISIIPSRDQYAVYTVAYTVDLDRMDPNNIEIPIGNRVTNFISSDETEGEVFTKGTNHNGTITLSKYPYVDYTRINADDATYFPIEVELSEHTITGIEDTVITRESETPTINKTDYKYLEKQTLVPYTVDVNDFFEYTHSGNKLQFVETFNSTSILDNSTINNGDATIRVKYQYLTGWARVKTILRRTNKTNTSATPAITSYSLIFKEKF